MDISIIIVTYNSEKYIKDCIKSILNNIGSIKYELFLVDNNSTDKTTDLICKIAKNNFNIKTVFNNVNLGFARANNLAIKKATGDYILLINPDCLIKQLNFTDLINYTKSDVKIGVLSCMIRNKDGTVSQNGGYFPNLFKAATWMLLIDNIPLINRLIKSFHIKYQSFYKKRRTMDWVQGAFFLFRKDIISKAGMFDEDFYMYTEDVEYCKRIKDYGYVIEYNPEWSVLHVGGASSTKEFPLLKEIEGVKLYFKKHQPEWQYIPLRILIKTGALIRMLIFLMIGDKERVKIYEKAFKIA